MSLSKDGAVRRKVELSMRYVIWKAVIEDGYCVCNSLEGFEDSRKLKRGHSVAHSFPDDACFRMDPDFPKDIMLSDNIRNGGGFLLVSNRLKEALEEDNEVNNVEWLPVKIINHKGRVASEEYVVANPLDLCDAIDRDRSEITWNSIMPDLIASCEKLVLDEEKIPADFKLFRLKHFSRRVVLRADFADKIKSRGFSQIAFTPAEGFSGF